MALSELEIATFSQRLTSEATLPPKGEPGTSFLEYMRTLVAEDAHIQTNVPYFNKVFRFEFESSIRQFSAQGLSTPTDALGRLINLFYALDRELGYRSTAMPRFYKEKQQLLQNINRHFGTPEYRLMFEYITYKLLVDIAHFDLLDMSKMASNARQAQLAEIIQQQQKSEDALKQISDSKLVEMQKAVDRINGWDGELSNYKKDTEALVLQIKGLKEEANFVGLSKAFYRLITEKKKESSVQVALAFAFGLILVAPPFHFIYKYYFDAPKATLDLIAQSWPYVVLELLILYFFRIFTDNYYAIKSQILQLKLRYSMCEFVQDYADFIQRVRAGDGGKTLERFEELIFANVTPATQRTPRQFDGVEQLLELAKLLKKD